MATSAKMSYNYYNTGKYGTLPQNSHKDAEVTQDMHLKMSKKIAQLTKVIYALNTKNDEHEAIVNSIKEQHEEAMQQLMAETKEKLALYQSRMGNDSELKKKVASLQECVTEHEKQKQKTLEEFETYKKNAEEREIKLKTEHSESVLELSREVLVTKKHFEEELKRLDDLKLKFEEDKRKTVEALVQRHHEEIEELRAAQNSQKGMLDSEREKLESLHKQEIERLLGQCDELTQDKKKISEEYEFKLSKAQAFYEKELEVLRNSQSSSHEQQLSDLLAQQDKLVKDFAFQEGQFKKRIDELLEQLSVSEDEAGKYKAELQELQKVLANRNSDTDTLSKQLSHAKQETADAVTRLKEIQAELAASKERCAEQAAEMLKRSTQLGQLEATRLTNEASIKELESQLAKLKDKLAWLEKERQSLQNKNQSTEEEKNNQLKSLEKSLEDLSITKQAMKERYDKEISNLTERAAARENQLQEEHKNALNEMMKKHKEELEAERRKAEERMMDVKQELEKKMESECNKRDRERDSIQSEFDRVKGELTARVQQAEDEVKRLEKLIRESEQGLGSATSHINSLKDASNKLKSELDATKAQLRASKSSEASLKSELEKLKALHDAKMSEAQEELKSKLDQLSRDLDVKWTDTLRKECSKLRSELTAQKEEDKRAALQQLTEMKNAEIAAAREGWERKVTQLLDEISMLKRNLDAKESLSNEVLEDLRRKMEAENKRLTAEMLQAAEEYANKIDAMEKIHTEKVTNLQAQKDKEIKDLEERLVSKHMEEMRVTMTAHKAMIDKIKSEAEKEREHDLEVQHKIHLSDKDTLKTELAHKNALEIEQLNKAHSTQLNAARIELDRAIELGKQKERDHEIRVSELQDNLNQRDRHIDHLEEEIKKLETGVEQLNKEMEFKGKEILKIRSEATQQLRKREEQLAKQHQKEIDNLSAEHLRETQDMLGEFNRAQELLKDKISALQIMLEEAEDKYRNRDSRPEDLEMINNLREALLEREQAMQKLVDDKRYYQMELMNRETNFNKVFNANPQVGVLNPFMKKKKGSDKTPNKYVSAPSLNTFGSNKLTPLSGSPIHDEKLNPKGPLPPTKKFLS